MSQLSEIHSVPAEQCKLFPKIVPHSYRTVIRGPNLGRTVRQHLSLENSSLLKLRHAVLELSQQAASHPFYRYNHMWTRDMQNAVRQSGSKMQIIHVLS